MSKVSKASSRNKREHGPVVDHAEELSDYAVNFVEFKQDIDATPLLKELPDGRCQCPHWGYVIKGRMTMRFADRDEVYEAGEAYYAPPGHIPVKHEPGTEIVQFSPRAELRATEAAMLRGMKAMEAVRATR